VFAPFLIIILIIILLSFFLSFFLSSPKVYPTHFSATTERKTKMIMEDFCIWQPFCTLVTKATVAILNFFSTPQKLPHTTVDIPTNFHEV
jgi:uncharacterized membrane protein